MRHRASRIALPEAESPTGPSVRVRVPYRTVRRSRRGVLGGMANASSYVSTDHATASPHGTVYVHVHGM